MKMRSNDPEVPVHTPLCRPDGRRDSPIPARLLTLPILSALAAAVGDVGGRARYVMSLCWSAFVLAEAGLLDGHAATTFPPEPAAARGFVIFAARGSEG